MNTKANRTSAAIGLALKKARLKKLYLAFHRERDRYSCGNFLALHLSPRLSAMERELERLYDECKALEKVIANDN